MPSLPDGWKLETKPRADGKVDIVGKDDTGTPYVARTTEGPGVTESDIKHLALTNRETSTARDVVKFFEDDRKRVDKELEDKMLDEYMDAADQAVFAGFHGQRIVGGYSRRGQENYERWLESLQEN